MSPFVMLTIIFGATPVIVACKSFIVSLCGNGATEVPRYHVMVGTGLPVEEQEILTESPSSTVTSPVRFMVTGRPAVNERQCNQVTNNMSLIQFTHNHQAGRSRMDNV